MEQTCVPVRHDPPATVSSVAGGGAGGTAVVWPGMVLARVSRPARTLTRGGRRNVAFGRPTAGCSIDLWSTCHVPRMDLAGESSLLPVIAAVLTARLSGQQVMINGNALHAPSSSRLRSLSARNPGPHGAPAARRGRTAWTAARISVVSWACPLAVAKKVRPSQKVTGLPGPLRRRSAPIADYFRLPAMAAGWLKYAQIVSYGTAHHPPLDRQIMSLVAVPQVPTKLKAATVSPARLLAVLTLRVSRRTSCLWTRPIRKMSGPNCRPGCKRSASTNWH